ncbi:hypothetical protein QE152_g24734 [Popillia japonica]|uniref:Peptidase A2 domain-containing protein n=1 Tax=Popillia japonica TaxID=7064 RepID=A0AAW1K3N1_POPJA
MITINDRQIIAFIDLGSEVVTARYSDACNLSLNYETSIIKLSGFGGGSCQTIGKCTYPFRIDDVEIVADIYIVPDYSQNDPIIIGRNVLDDHNIKVTIQGKMLTIENVNVKQVCQIEHNKNYKERNVVNEMVQ